MLVAGILIGTALGIALTVATLALIIERLPD